jgi:hypothetical protein
MWPPRWGEGNVPPEGDARRFAMGDAQKTPTFHIQAERFPIRKLNTEANSEDRFFSFEPWVCHRFSST